MKSPKQQLKRLFAVTCSGSVYLMSDAINEFGDPTVKKVAGRAKASMKVGHQFVGGSMVGIGGGGQIGGLVLFYPQTKYGRQFWQMNSSMLRGRTTDIVALFRTRRAAELCRKKRGLKEWDPRWRRATLGTVDAIGQNHNVFVLPECVKLAILGKALMTLP